MKKQNVAEKYLTQKRTGAIDIVFILLTVVGAILFLMHWRYYGVPALAIGVAGLIFTSSAKIKDAEFDHLIDEIIISKRIEIQGDSVFRSFCVEKQPRVMGKDKKMRTPVYCITVVNYSQTDCQITVHKFDVLKMDLDTRKFSLPYDSDVKLIEGKIATDAGNKKFYYIVAEECSLKFPIENISIDVDDFTAHFNK